MKAAILAAVFALAAVPHNTEPKPWQRETWHGTINVESNPWGGFMKRTFGLWSENEEGYTIASEDLAFATEAEYRQADRLAECRVEVVGFRVRRADTSWIVVESIRERTR